MSEKPNYRVNRRNVKMTERVAMAAVGKSVLRAQKVHGTDTSIMFAERASGYHTSPHMHDCEQMNYIVSGEIYFFVDGRGYRCKAGDVMRIPRNKVHWAWNRGSETAVPGRQHDANHATKFPAAFGSSRDTTSEIGTEQLRWLQPRA